MDCSLVPFRIKSHSANQLGASHWTLLNQDAASSNADHAVKQLGGECDHGVSCGVDFVILQDRNEVTVAGYPIFHILLHSQCLP